MTKELIDEFRKKFQKDREHCSASSGASLLMSEKGPVGFGTLEALFRIVEAQQEQIQELELRLSRFLGSQGKC